MEWEKFKKHFDESYHPIIRPFIESEKCDAIYTHLKERSKKGHKIAPSSSHTFRCFQETPLNEIKVVLVGMAPYHTMMKTVNGEMMVADGLLMGCSNTGVLQPSLRNFYDGIMAELHPDERREYSPDVSYLARQGVFMFNASLTTEINKAGSHLELWRPFTKYVIEEILNHLGVPIVFLGKDAGYFERYTFPFSWTFTISHPASAAYKGTDWDTEGIFTTLNKILKDSNNFTINWVPGWRQ